MTKPVVTCQDGVRVLGEYAEGTLSPAVRRAVEAHVGGCVRCQRFVASYMATPRLVRQATDESMPADLRRRLRARLRGDVTRTGRRRP